MASQDSPTHSIQDVQVLDGAVFRESYVYQQLKEPQSQIRLLHLRSARVLNCRSSDHPQSVYDEPTFNCSIETIDLDHSITAETPPYHAISYVWGNATDTRPIVCDGQIKKITRNLWEFLLRCWRRTHGDLKSDNLSVIASFGRPLWIDAICINQNDLTEKGYQVQQMGRIYSRAAAVLMWLGPHNEIAQDAQDVMIPLDTRGTFGYDPCPPQSGSDATVLADLDGKWESQLAREEMLELLDFVLSLFPKDDWKRFNAFVSLMDLEYWSRAWVVQEMASANHNRALVLIGDRLWAWATLVNAAHTLMVIMYLFNAEKDWPALREWPRDKILTLRYYAVILNEFVLGTMSAQPLRLAEIIPRAIFRTTNATLRVDHIYSLLSLASDQDSCGVIPDYTKSVSQVYQNLCTYLLRTVGADALTFCEICRTSNLELPSWVPDFSYHNVYTFKMPRLDPTRRRIYSAGGPRETFTYRVRGTSLHLRGRRIDTICHFAQFDHHGNFERDDAPAWLRSFQDFVENAVVSHGTDPKDAWRVPIADQFDSSADDDVGVRAPPNVVDAYHELLGHDGIASLSGAAINYARAVVLWGSCHLPFVTDGGHLGLGRPCVEKGDAVFICTGADTPLIVREVAGEIGKVKIVAEAYLAGFMDGECLANGFDESHVEVV